MAGKWMASIMASLIFVVIGAGITTGVIKLPLQDVFQSEVATVPEALARDERRRRGRGGRGVGFGITIDLGKIFSGSEKKKRKAKKRRTRKPVKRKARRKPEKRKARRKPEKKRKEWKVIEGTPELPTMKLTAVAGWKKYYEGCEYDVAIGWVIVKADTEGKYCIWMGGECAEKNSSKKGGKCTCNPGFDEKTYPNCKPHGWKDPVREAKTPSPARRKLKPVPSIGLPDFDTATCSLLYPVCAWNDGIGKCICQTCEKCFAEYLTPNEAFCADSESPKRILERINAFKKCALTAYDPLLDALKNAATLQGTPIPTELPCSKMKLTADPFDPSEMFTYPTLPDVVKKEKEVGMTIKPRGGWIGKLEYCVEEHGNKTSALRDCLDDLDWRGVSCSKFRDGGYQKKLEKGPIRKEIFEPRYKEEKCKAKKTCKICEQHVMNQSILCSLSFGLAQNKVIEFRNCERQTCEKCSPEANRRAEKIWSCAQTHEGKLGAFRGCVGC